MVTFDRNTWQTPDYLLDAVREVFRGEIGLDPASSVTANARVRAESFYTEEQNGLILPWRGKIFLNPPYSRGLIGKFVDKFVEADGKDAGIVVVNAATDTKWFRKLAAACDRVCFPPRIAFLHPETGLPVKGNRFNQAIFYAGDEPERFTHVFGRFGPVFQEVFA